MKAILQGQKISGLPSGGIPIVTTSGTASAYTATVSGITELINGMLLVIVPHINSNAGATLNVNGLGAVPISTVSSGPVGVNGGNIEGISANFLLNQTAVLLQYTYDGMYWSWLTVSNQIKYATDIIVSRSTNYTDNQVRGISLQTSTPSSIQNGCIVGVYST